MTGPIDVLHGRSVSRRSVSRRSLIVAGVLLPTTLAGCAPAAPVILPPIQEIVRRLAGELLYSAAGDGVKWLVKKGADKLHGDEASGEGSGSKKELVPSGPVYVTPDGDAVWAVRPEGVDDLSLHADDRVALWCVDGHSSLIRPRAGEAIHRTWADWVSGWDGHSDVDSKKATTDRMAARALAPLSRIKLVHRPKDPLQAGDTFGNAFWYRTAAGSVTVARVDRVPTKRSKGGEFVEVSVVTDQKKRYWTWTYPVSDDGLSLA